MLSADQLLAFGVDGYLVVPGAVAPDAVAAAQRVVDGYRAADPPDVVGPRFDFPTFAEQPALAALYASPVVEDAVASLLGEANVLPSGGLQLARTLPPFPRPHAGRPHVDGATGEPGGAPQSFSLLAGVALTDQLTPADGALWVWPGSHREHAAHYAALGAEGFWAGDPGFPDVARAAPVVVPARAGDLVLCHYLLGHCPGGVEARPRATTYVRVTSARHVWRDSLVDWKHDFPPVDAASGSGAAVVV